MATDPRVDAYIDKAEPFAQPILRHVRALVHSALPEAEEAIKWGMPHFTVGGKNVVGMAAFRAHAAVMIHGEDDSAEGMGTLGKIGALGDLPPDENLAARFRAAADAFASGKASTRAAKPKPEIAMPDDFGSALEAAPQARAFFGTLAPSYRREYLEWILEAKRPETRAKRIATAVEWLGEGKKRNWKYAGC
ncbi:YdeI/OmpD-associated family protein [Pelagerythrobacter rhizovicinus]|uniref:YdhG-like domain-containing protein n=1 Tax=Pelagerythrobacter rhizovicinus TaxID=2268576 RepID=A0A4V1QWI6_9SPHN|nr:YdeI/OmpD-associated family protein [Pelagerythrobacter rhizovicinus]RXZ66286.1 hypothetical protein ETX26_06180 [Pelagerythrobacter rhizovicinus]